MTVVSNDAMVNSPEDMTDRELLIEIVTTLRAATAALEAASSNPMLRAFMPKM